MISFIKKPLQEGIKGQNTQSLKRFRKPLSLLGKRKKLEVEFSNKKDNNALALLRQMGIRKGKKTQSEKRIIAILLKLKKKYRRRDLNSMLNIILKKFRALIFLRAKRLGSVTYKIPIALFKKKGIRVIARWIMQKRTLKNKKNNNILDIIVNLSKKQGEIYKKRQDLHRQGYSGIPYLTYVTREHISK
jgi:ribosomal protein S7